MRQIIRLLIQIKRKLHHLHALEGKSISKIDNIISNQTQILGDNPVNQVILLQNLEKLIALCLNPVAIFSSVFRCINRPKSFKSSKMIQTNHIVHFQIVIQPFQPPIKSSFFTIIPIIHRISPILSSFRKSVRRNTCDKFRRQILVHHKHIWILPHVAALLRHINR